MTRSARRHLGPAVLAAALAAGLAGCGPSSPAAPVAGHPTTAASDTTRSAPPKPSPTALVTSVVLTDADFHDGSRVTLIPSGDQVRGQVTMDNCGYRFTTEAHRVARRQVVLVPSATDQAEVSNEVVAYDSVASATKAMVELRRSVTGCPKGVYERSTVAANPPMRYDVSRLVTPRGLPVADSAEATLAVRAKGTNESWYSFMVFQRRGTVIDAVYVNSPAPVSSAYVAFGLQLARITGTRLAATPA